MELLVLLKRHPRKVGLIILGLVATIVCILLLLFLRKGENKTIKKTIKEDSRKEGETKNGTALGGSTGKNNRPLGKSHPRDACELQTEEYKACLSAFLKRPEESGRIEGVKTAYKSMLQVCPPGQASLDSSVISDFEKLVSEILHKPSASVSDLKEMERKLEAVKKLVPGYEPIKSLEKQFAEKFGPEYFLSLGQLETATEPAEVARIVKKLDSTHAFAKIHRNVDPIAAEHPSLSQESFTEFLKTDNAPKSAEVLNIVNTEKSELLENPKKEYLEAKKSFDTDGASKIKLRDIYDFDIDEYTSKIQQVVTPIDTLDRMSQSELEAYCADQKAQGDKSNKESRSTESDGHKANHYLAKILLQAKPAEIKQTTFDAWKTAGFTAGPEYIRLVRECANVESFSALAMYSGHLCDFAGKRSTHKAFYMNDAFSDSEAFLDHYADSTAYAFIYSGITKLKPEDSKRFEAAMLSQSVEDMRALARKCLESGEYSNFLMDEMCLSMCFDVEKLKNKTFRMVMAFGEEVEAHKQRKVVQRKLEKIKSTFGFEPGFAAALEKKDASELVAQYKECIAKGKQAHEECAELIAEYKFLYYYLSHLDMMMDDGAEKRNKEVLEDVIEPALLLLIAEAYLVKEDTTEYWRQLNENGIACFEEAIKESAKLKLKQQDFTLYKKLCLIEKCRDYVRHSNNFSYIKKDFVEVHKCALLEKRSRAYSYVDKIIAELEKPIDKQRCTFDMTTKKLNCADAEMKKMLVSIHRDKESAKMLTRLIRCAVDMNSLPEALHIYKSLSKMYHAMDSASFYLFDEIGHRGPARPIVIRLTRGIK